MWTHAGEVSFKVDTARYRGKSVYHYYSYGTTFKKYDWIFKVRDTYQAYADIKTLQPYWFKRVINEGSDYIYNEYWFNFPGKKAYTISKVNKSKLKQDTVTISTCVFDVLSMVYYARTIDFEQYKQGDMIPIRLFLEENEYATHIRYLGIEDITTRDKQTYRCYKFSPQLIEGALFKGGEGMLVWVTADEKKIPVFIESEIRVGNIKAYLRKKQ